MLLFSYSFHVPWIILRSVYFYIVCSMFSILLNWTQAKASVVNQMSHLLLKLKNVFLLFSTFWKWSFPNVVSTLINVVKFDVENYNIVWTMSNVVTINVEKDKVDLALFNVDIHNVVSTLIWHCPTSRRNITLTTALRQRWKVSWVLTNIAKRLHNFVKFIKLKTYIFRRILLNCCFHKLSKWYF